MPAESTQFRTQFCRSTPPLAHGYAVGSSVTSTDAKRSDRLARCPPETVCETAVPVAEAPEPWWDGAMINPADARPSESLSVTARARALVTVIGGPTALIEVGGLRILVDPTFDPVGPHGALVKTGEPAIPAADIGTLDLVLVSHAEHADNLDTAGLEVARSAPVVFTGAHSAELIGASAVALKDWESRSVPRPDGRSLTVTAVPAHHGPEDGRRDAFGDINCEVHGFVLSGPGLPTLYVSGDNASIAVVREISDRLGPFDAAVVNAGAARVASKFSDRPLSMTSERAAAVAALLAPARIIPAHHDGWAHFSEGIDRIVTAFDDAGLIRLLAAAPAGAPIAIP